MIVTPSLTSANLFRELDKVAEQHVFIVAYDSHSQDEETVTQVGSHFHPVFFSVLVTRHISLSSTALISKLKETVDKVTRSVRHNANVYIAFYDVDTTSSSAMVRDAWEPDTSGDSSPCSLVCVHLCPFRSLRRRRCKP